MSAPSCIPIDRLEELRAERGLSYRAIAAEFGVHPGTVAWQCLKHGIERRGAEGPVRSYAIPAGYVRRGHPVRAYTAAEDARLLALAAEGAGFSAIGRALGRRSNSIAGRLYTLARYEARSEAPGL